MRAIVIFVSTVLLSGCQSDFDKCMETEAPRAEAILALSDLSEAITNFQSASIFALMLYQAEANFESERASSEPEGRPVYPEYPTYACSLDDMSRAVWQDCSDAYEVTKKAYEEEKAAADLALEEWNARPDVSAWYEESDAKFLNSINSAGLEATSLEEAEHLVSSREAELEMVNAALIKRATESDCWGAGVDSCDDPISYEVELKFGLGFVDDGYYAKRVETAKLAFAEILMTMTDQYSAATTKAQELAVLTCNQNGLYE